MAICNLDQLNRIDLRKVWPNEARDFTKWLSVESNLIGFSEDAYGKKVSLRWVEFLRGEQKFDGLDALKSQIAHDKQQAEECVKNAWQRGLQATGDVLK